MASWHETQRQSLIGEIDTWPEIRERARREQMALGFAVVSVCSAIVGAMLMLGLLFATGVLP